jgi:hypothetical protein
MKNDQEIEVKMVDVGDGPVTRTYKQTINKFDKLGKEIKISPKACAMVCKPGFTTEYFVDTVNVLVGIGKDHTADLTMTRDAWEALKQGEEVTITTLEEFKKNYL